MSPDASCADTPRSLKRLIDPLSSLLGVQATLAASQERPPWPDPGREAHILLHREFAEHGSCPDLTPPFAPSRHGDAVTTCPLGLVVQRFSLPLEKHGTGVLTLGPYFLDPQAREALVGRSPAADAALRLLPLLSPQRHEQLQIFAKEFSMVASSIVKADAAKALFLSNMSHELRTPLNGIMGMLSLVLQGELEGRQRQFLQLAMDASNQLLGVVNDLLEMTHISLGGLTLTEKAFGLRQTLAPLLTACAEEADGRGLTFVADIDDDVPESLLGDPSRLLQVLRNLIENAVKFTEAGSVSIRVTGGFPGDMPGRTTLHFAVADTGIGIPRDRQERIFERFAIGEDFLGKRYGNSGLGLSISKEIIEKMGGSIRLDSTAGQGSVFSFSAVFRLAGVAPAPTATDTTRSSFRCEGAVIVCAENDPVGRLLLRRILEDRGYVTLPAPTRDQLEDILRSQPVDLVLLDMGLEDLEAADLLHNIRSGLYDGVPPDLPVVGLLAKDATRRPSLPSDDGMTGCLAKPVTRQGLLEAVGQALPHSPPTGLL